MNLVETLSANVTEHAEAIGRLRDEITRFKGEQGKPKIKPNKAERSSEKERRKSQAHHKASKQASIQMDREEVVRVDQHILPADAVVKG